LLGGFSGGCSSGVQDLPVEGCLLLSLLNNVVGGTLGVGVIHNLTCLVSLGSITEGIGLGVLSGQSIGVDSVGSPFLPGGGEGVLSGEEIGSINITTSLGGRLGEIVNGWSLVGIVGGISDSWDGTLGWCICSSNDTGIRCNQLPPLVVGGSVTVDGITELAVQPFSPESLLGNLSWIICTVSHDGVDSVGELGLETFESTLLGIDNTLHIVGSLQSSGHNSVCVQFSLVVSLSGPGGTHLLIKGIQQTGNVFGNFFSNSGFDSCLSGFIGNVPGTTSGSSSYCSNGQSISIGDLLVQCLLF
jgi:hypothetical protein